MVTGSNTASSVSHVGGAVGGAVLPVTSDAAIVEQMRKHLLHDFFLSHYQATGGDQVMSLELRLTSMGYTCWLDQKAATITKESMQTGVSESRVFLLFLSEGVLTRPFCLFEIETAMTMQKKMLMHETDSRHVAFAFEVIPPALPSIKTLLETHESLPYRRRRFEQDAILAELVRNSGLTSGMGETGTATSSNATDTSGTAKPTSMQALLAPVPDATPQLPDAFSPRPNDQAKVLDVLLRRTAEAHDKSKVLAHGMGGMGKTTLAAAIVRNKEVREAYTRIAFVSAGQEPASLELQRVLHMQLVGAVMEVKSGATVATQREVLTEAVTEKAILLVRMSST